MSLNRRGASLVELVVATGLTALLAGLAGSILMRAAHALRSRSERMALEQSLRAAAGALRQAVEPLGRDAGAGGDLAAATPAAMMVRVLRGSGTVCAVAPNDLIVRAGREWWSALRDPVAGRDSLLVAGLAEGSGWRAVGLSDAPRPDRCPDGGEALALPVGGGADSLAAVGAGSPLRVFEPLELRVYAASSAEWLGLRQAATGESVQPLAGPLALRGTALSYLRTDGSAAENPAEVASVRLDLQALTEHPGGLGLTRVPAERPDSVVIVVGLRGVP